MNILDFNKEYKIIFNFKIEINLNYNILSQLLFKHCNVALIISSCLRKLTENENSLFIKLLY